MRELPPDQARRMQWWLDARFGMFIHVELTIRTAAAERRSRRLIGLDRPGRPIPPRPPKRTRFYH